MLERLPGGGAALTSAGVRGLGSRSLPGVGQRVVVDCEGTLGATPRTPPPAHVPRGGVPFVPTVGVDSAQRPYSGAGFVPFTRGGPPVPVYDCRPRVRVVAGEGGGVEAGFAGQDAPVAPVLDVAGGAVVFQFRDGSLYPLPVGAQVVAGQGYAVAGRTSREVDAVPDSVATEALTGGPTLFKGGVVPSRFASDGSYFNIIRIHPEANQFYDQLAGTVQIDIRLDRSVRSTIVITNREYYTTGEAGTYEGGQGQVTESLLVSLPSREVVTVKNYYTLGGVPVQFRAVFRAGVRPGERDQWFIITDVTNYLGYETDSLGRRTCAIVRTIVMPGASDAPIKPVEYYATHPEELRNDYQYITGIDTIVTPPPGEAERITRLSVAGGRIRVELSDSGVLRGGVAFGRSFGAGTFAVMGMRAGPVLFHATPDGLTVRAFSEQGVETVTAEAFMAGSLGRQPGAGFVGFSHEGCAAHEPPPVVFAVTTGGLVMLAEWDAWRDAAPSEWPARPPQPRNPRENPPARRPPLGVVGASFAAALMGAEVRAQGQPWGHLPAAVARDGRDDPAALAVVARPPSFAPGGWLTDDVNDTRALRPVNGGAVEFTVKGWAGAALPPVRHLPPPPLPGREPAELPDPMPGVAAYLLRVQARRDVPLTVEVNGEACEVLPLGPVPEPAAVAATARYFIPVLALSTQPYEAALGGCSVRVSWAVSRFILGRVTTVTIIEDDGGGTAT